MEDRRERHRRAVYKYIYNTQMKLSFPITENTDRMRIRHIHILA